MPKRVLMAAASLAVAAGVMAGTGVAGAVGADRTPVSGAECRGVDVDEGLKRECIRTVIIKLTSGQPNRVVRNI